MVNHQGSPFITANWLLDSPIDHEYKTYLIQGYLNRILHGIEYNIMYPHYDEMLFHFRLMEGYLKEGKFSDAIEVPARLRPFAVDEENDRIKSLTKDPAILLELNKTASWAIEQFKAVIFKSIGSMDKIKKEFVYRILKTGQKLDVGTLVVQSTQDNRFTACKYSVPSIKTGGKVIKSTIFSEFFDIPLPLRSKFSLDEQITRKINSEHAIVICTIPYYIPTDQRNYLAQKFLLEFIGKAMNESEKKQKVL